MIKVNELNKYYNKGKSSEIHVINNTSLELPSTGLITFLGHSGSGKTTLLNVIGGLDKAKGVISYDNVSFNRYNPTKLDKFRSANIGYVFQNYNLLLEETVYDNLRIALELIGITDLEEQQKRIEHSLKAVGMYKYRKKIASFLSGGQQQRVSIARALIKKSKVIIADEPTGNLDSKNTLEVMNILRKISKQSLVLLVTHEVNVANFYSDIIYELKDGSIIDKRIVSDNETFKDNDDSTVYLKDLNQNEFNTELGNITIHSYDNEELKADFHLIIKNGTIYLSSNKPVKLLEQSNLNVIDEHKKDIKREDIDSFNYDTSWFNDTKGNKKVFFKFLRRISNSFISFRAVGKKQKFLYICLMFIGALIGLSFCILSNAVSFDLSHYSYSNNIECIYNKGGYYTKTEFEKAIKEGKIDSVTPCFNGSLTLSDQITYNYGQRCSFSVDEIVYRSDKVDLIMGNEPNDGEIVISYNMISELASKLNKNAKEYLGTKITYKDRERIISGFSKNDNCMVYVNNNDYSKDVAWDFSQDVWFYFIYNSNAFVSKYELRYYENNNYEIVEGRDVDKEAYLLNYSREVLVPMDWGFDIGDTISDLYATVVGKYKSSDDSQALYVNFEVKYDYSEAGLIPIFEDTNLLNICEGSFPKGQDEVLVSVYSNYKVGDYVGRNQKYKVSGLYSDCKDLTKQFLFCNPSTYFVEKTEKNNGFFIDGESVDEFTQSLANQELELLSTYDRLVKETKINRKDSIKYFVYIFLGTTAVSAIFVYFVMRSKMLSDIYNIGVYRSLGASRKRIDLKYLSDIFILTTFTGLIGYSLTVLFYYAEERMINSFTNSVAQVRILMLNFGLVGLGVVVLYLIMFIFGMLPIIFLQTKTPSEIIAKYDI